MFDPIGATNAASVRNKHPAVFQPLTLMYQIALSMDLLLGPEAILVRHRRRSHEYAFECIFRVLTIEPNRRRESWAVYRREREWDTEPEDDAGVILRHVVWDKATDQTERTWKRGEGPAISMATRYVSALQAARLTAPFQALDALIAAGLSLQPRSDTDRPRWQELWLFRSLDWGRLELSWHFAQENSKCEAAVTTLQEVIGEILDEETQRGDTKVAEMGMIYEYTPYLALG